jgi:glycosyltransferase involved in cell wall biosynthesis
MRVLVIGYVWPEPNSSAAGRHMLSLLRLFRKQEWEVHFATPAKKTEFMHDLSIEQVASHDIELNDSAFDPWIKALSPDIVVFDRFMMEEQFGWRVAQQCPNALRILDTEDLQSLRNARYQAHKEGRAVSNADFHSEIAKRELAAIWRCDLSLIIARYEHHWLQHQFAVDRHLLHLLPFMVDEHQLPNRLPDFAQRQHFVAIGNFRHAPNWDSVLYLRELWPAIRERLPDAELHIYGAYAPPKATALHNSKLGFLIKDRAKDALAVIQQARVLLAPLRFGAGIKGKLLDAMIAKTPSVTTSIGAESMISEGDWPGAICDDDRAFVQASVELYQNSELWGRASRLCHPILARDYSAQELGDGLINRILTIKAKLTEHRQRNFIGAMLQHHQLKSTCYMSKWIEAKNKLQHADKQNRGCQANDAC